MNAVPLRIGEGEAGRYRGRLTDFRIEQHPLDDRAVAALAATPPAEARP
jgi:hypothetical protein